MLELQLSHKEIENEDISMQFFLYLKLNFHEHNMLCENLNSYLKQMKLMTPLILIFFPTLE